MGEFLDFFHLAQAQRHLFLRTADLRRLLFALPLQVLQLAFFAAGAGRQVVLLGAPGFQRLEGHHLPLVFTQQLRALPGFFQARLLKRRLGLLDIDRKSVV